MSKVLQMYAHEGVERAVLDHLFQHAWRRGAAAIEGRMEPRLARMLGQRHCLFHSTSAFALIHSRDAEPLGALARGDAFFSRLEGEFLGEPHDAFSSHSVVAGKQRFAPLRPGQQPALP
jgi:hypothetical protein